MTERSATENMQKMTATLAREGTASLRTRSRLFQQCSNVIKRVILGTIMISGFLAVIFMGPMVLILVGLVIEVLCFKEILHIGYTNNKMPSSLPYFRSLCWYFLTAANYFFFIELVAPHFQEFYKNFFYLRIIITYHRFISFCIYFIGMIFFLLSLVRKYDSKQFRILAWTHTLLIIIVLQSYMMIETLFHGLIWLILSVSLVILNDIFAFMCGRLWGRTPLIELSPKKTWEGFIGGMVGTLISGFILSNAMCRFKYFVCPIEYREFENEGIKLDTDCTPSYLFVPTTYSFGPFISIDFYPFTWHFLALALFASIIAPFAGFCASGFKRAVNIKDFGNAIPGHGGIMDRFDCQFLMAPFVNVYIITFVTNPTASLIFEQILYMDKKNQLQFYVLLRDTLIASNLLNATENYT